MGEVVVYINIRNYVPYSKQFLCLLNQLPEHDKNGTLLYPKSDSLVLQTCFRGEKGTENSLFFLVTISSFRIWECSLFPGTHFQTIPF